MKLFVDAVFYCWKMGFVFYSGLGWIVELVKNGEVVYPVFGWVVEVWRNGEDEEPVVYKNGEVDTPDADMNGLDLFVVSLRKGLGLVTELRRGFVFCCSGLEFCSGTEGALTCKWVYSSWEDLTESIVSFRLALTGSCVYFCTWFSFTSIPLVLGVNIEAAHLFSSSFFGSKSIFLSYFSEMILSFFNSLFAGHKLGVDLVFGITLFIYAWFSSKSLAEDYC